jgi:PAS domain S-box-containing protein
VAHGASNSGHSDDRIRIVCHTALDALFTVDDGRRFVRANEPATKLLAASTTTLRTRTIEDFTPEQHMPLLDVLWANFERDGRQEGHYEVQAGDGSLKLVEYRATRHFDTGEHLIAARELGVWSRLDDPGLWGRQARPRITPREREILQLVANGNSAPEIARVLVVSPGTVKTHLKHVYEKLGARDRGSAVAAGLRTGLIE